MRKAGVVVATLRLILIRLFAVMLKRLRLLLSLKDFQSVFGGEVEAGVVEDLDQLERGDVVDELETATGWSICISH